MRLNTQKIERVTERIIGMLGVEAYLNGIEFRHERSNGLCGYMQKNGCGYNVVIYVNECGSEREIIHTIAHELRHIWQAARGFNIVGKHGLYNKTYSTNVFEVDADRFGDIIAYKKRYKTNEDGLYINNLDIVKHGVHIMIAKAIA